nr:hypothetical protein [Acidobacteriota bacterium]
VFFGAWDAAAMQIDAAVAKPVDVVAQVRAIAQGRRVHIAGDGAVRYAAEWAAAGWTRVTPEMTLAEGALRLVVEARVVAGAPHAVRPLYVRRTDAEINRERGGRRA